MGKFGMQKTAKERAKKQAEGFQKRLGKQVEQARQQVGERWMDARDRMGDVRIQAADVWEDTADYVRDNPGKILAFSVAAGMAAGLIWSVVRGQTIED